MCANCHSERITNNFLYSDDFLKDGTMLYSRIDIAKNLDPNGIEGQVSIRRRSILKETPGEEILRCGRHRRQAKFVPAKASFVKAR